MNAHILKAHDRTQARQAQRNDRLDRWRIDMRVAFRALRRTPAFTIATVAILALSIGAATAIATVYKMVLVDQLPVEQVATVRRRAFLLRASAGHGGAWAGQARTGQEIAQDFSSASE